MELSVFSIVGSVTLAYHPKVPTMSCIFLIPSGDNCGDVSSGFDCCVLVPYWIGSVFGWGMLRFGWGGVLVFCESFFHEAGYAGVEGSVVVVPFETDTDIFASGPVDCDVVPLLQGVLR